MYDLLVSVVLTSESRRLKNLNGESQKDLFWFSLAALEPVLYRVVELDHLINKVVKSVSGPHMLILTEMTRFEEFGQVTLPGSTP